MQPGGSAAMVCVDCTQLDSMQSRAGEAHRRALASLGILHKAFGLLKIYGSTMIVTFVMH